jgi:DedD protein
MARSISEQELQLKKRARRRLVGAIVLVTAVAVVLPMVLDSEPQPVRQNVDIHIPSPDAGEFKSKASEAAQQPAAPIKGLPEGPPAVPPTPEAAAGNSTTAPSPPAIARAPIGGPPITEPPASRTPPAAADRPAASGKERVETPRPAPPAPKVEAPPPRAPVSDRTDTARSAGASKPKSEAPAKAESTRVASAEPKRSADTASDAGGYVVQVAALADPAKVRQLQKQMSGAGLKTYTEVVSTKAGQVTRVRAGPYATREAAEKARAQLKKAGLDGQVVAK